jgi:glycosyltransferase involved in cell wall biosynthesis
MILIARAGRRVRQAPDLETRVLLAAVCAPLVGIFATYFSASASAVSPSSPYLWFSAGIFSWWLTPGAGRARQSGPSRSDFVVTPPPVLPAYEPPVPQRVTLPEPAMFAPTPPAPLPRAAEPPRVEDEPRVLEDMDEPVIEEPLVEAPPVDDEPPPAVPEAPSAPEPRTPVVALVYRGQHTRIDGIRAYTERLARAVASTPDLESRSIFSGRFDDELDDVSAVVVQYNPFSYGRYGFAPWLPRALRKLRSRPNPPVVAVMVHEAYAHVTSPRSAVISYWQRLQLRSILRNADVAFTATEALAQTVDDLHPDCPVRHLPVGSNLPDARDMRNVERRALGLRNGELVVAAFGTGHPSQLSTYLVNAANAIAADRPGMVFLNLGAGVSTLEGLADNIRLVEPGELDEDRLAAMLSSADLFLAPFVDGVSTRRTTLMAALQHALPVVGTEARQTDEVLRTSRNALRLVPARAQRTFITAARQLAREDGERHTLAVNGRALYDEHFHWDRIRAALVEELDDAATPG